MAYPEAARLYGYGSSSSGLMGKMSDAMGKSRDAMEEMRAEFLIDSRYKAGDTSLYGEQYRNQIPRFAQDNKWNFNLILHYVDMLTGEQRQNRKEMVLLPSKLNPTQEQRQVSEIRSAAMRNVTDRSDILFKMSDLFEDSCTMGLSWLFFYRDFSQDPQFGQLNASLCSYDEVIFDPDFTNIDLSDCDYVWMNKMLSREALKDRLPDYAELIDELPSGARFTDVNNPNVNRVIQLADKDKLEYNEFHYQSTTKASFLVHPDSRETIQLTNPEEEFLRSAKRMGFEIFERNVSCWKQGVSIGDEEIYDGANSLNVNMAPFVPSICYLNRNVGEYANKFQGIPAQLRDTQFIFTYQTIMQFKMIELQINNGCKFKPGSLVDREVPLQDGMDYRVPIRDDASMDDFQTIPRSPIDPTIVNMKDSLISLAERITGISAQDQGHEMSNDPSGIAEVLRHAKTRIPWQGILDRFDQSFKQAGRLIDAFIANNWSSEKLSLATGMDAPDGWNLPFVSRYDVVVRPGTESMTQQQAQFQQYASLMAMGAPMQWSDMLKTAPLIYSSDLIERMTEQEQKNAEMAEEKQRLELERERMEMELKRASAQALDSKALNEQATAQDKLSRMEAEVQYKESLTGEASTRSFGNVARAIETLNKIDVQKLELLHSIDKDQVNILLDIAKTLKEDVSDGLRGVQQEGRGGNSSQGDAKEASPADEEINGQGSGSTR